jgi:hypothetical protein
MQFLIDYKKDLPVLKRLYNKALKEKKDSFIWKGQLFLIGYAKYLLEYLEMQLKEIIKNKKLDQYAN